MRQKKIDKEKTIQKDGEQNLLVLYSFVSPFIIISFFSKLHFTVEMQTTLDRYGSILLGSLLLRH